MVEQLTLITGASRGIGAATARELAKRGHDLILTARPNEQGINPALERVADEIMGINEDTRVFVRAVDAANSVVMTGLLDGEIAQRIDGAEHMRRNIVLNAGVGDCVDLAKMPKPEARRLVERTLAVNTKGPMDFLREGGLEWARNSGGNVVYVSSAVCSGMRPADTFTGNQELVRRLGQRGLEAYTLSKLEAERQIALLREEVRDAVIHVVRFGMYDTKLVGEIVKGFLNAGEGSYVSPPPREMLTDVARPAEEAATIIADLLEDESGRQCNVTAPWLAQLYNAIKTVSPALAYWVRDIAVRLNAGKVRKHYNLTPEQHELLLSGRADGSV